MALAALALVCALASTARASTVTPRIVGGGASGPIPYQAAVFTGGGFCGGVVYDATTVITAAHCVVDFGTKDLSAIPGVQVVAGTANLATRGPDTAVARAKTLSLDSRYDPGTNDHDIAKIELASPLWTGTPPAAIQPIGIVSDTSFQSLLDNLDKTPVTATVSGWGCTDPVAGGSDTCPDPLPDDLQSVDIPLIKQADCVADYGVFNPPVPITDNMFCAGIADGSGNKDSCFGDSGGPLTIPDPDLPSHPAALAGLVDSGYGCAQTGFPGIYTRVSALVSFVTATDPSPGAAGPSLTGTPDSGQTLTCNPGAWAGTVSQFRYRFFRDNGSGSISPLSSYGSSAGFTVPSSLVGSSVFCQVEATGTGAVRVADSAEVAITVPPPVQPSPPSPPPPAVDSSAPKLRVLSKRCTKTSCTVKVRVTDAAPSSGIGKLRVTLGWSKRVKCTARRGEGERSTRPARTCIKRVKKSLRAKAGSGGSFTIVAKHLRPGTGYRLTLLPFDRANNRPHFSTITNVRTKSLRSSGPLR